MKSSKRFFILAAVCYFLLNGLSVCTADEDTAQYQTAVTLNFETSDKTYARFESQVYELNSPMDNLLISVDSEKSDQAEVHCYARFRMDYSNRWTDYKEFDNEYHFAKTLPTNAYQMLFIVLDKSGGKTVIKSFTAQGKKLGEEVMISLEKKPKPITTTIDFPKPEIVTRKQWGARPPKSDYTLHSPTKIVVHHSWIPNQLQYIGSASIRGIQGYHMDSSNTGWIDIGYHYLIGPDGLIYEGRPDTAVGSHCSPNKSMIGVCVIGNYDPEKDPLNEKIETSLLKLLSWLCYNYKINPERELYGHRNFSTKTCPGDTVYNRHPYYIEEIIKNIGMKKLNEIPEEL
ncbi:MAG: N-acetylmuramoyl-L-alanine amidase [Candidatus Riflebacteria bacterium]|nr:N-acetylmuramoyl-L-alanine amidase [Candidatus Riflebacteria bacterium]